MGARTVGRLTVLPIAVFVSLAIVSASMGQESKPTARYQFKIGVLRFIDNTGAGDKEVGAAVSRHVQAELSHSTQMIGRVLDASADNVDGAKAAEIGREASVDVVLVGTVMEAASNQSNKHISGPSIFGQSVGGSTHSVSSVVTLQGDLYNVADGGKIASIRVTGKATDRKLGTDIRTDIGSITTGGASFESSPIGKATQKAVADLVKRIDGVQSKMLPNKPAADTPK